MSDPKAREEFIQAHVRRLEAMRRAGHAKRNSDGSWKIPKDYLAKATKFEKSRGYSNPVKLDVRSHLPLTEQLKAQRLDFLKSEGVIREPSNMSQVTLDKLERIDLEDAGRTLSRRLGKPYQAASGSGRISGIYRKAIQRPSGKYAIIEKSKEFITEERP